MIEISAGRKKIKKAKRKKKNIPAAIFLRIVTVSSPFFTKKIITTAAIIARNTIAVLFRKGKVAFVKENTP